MSLSDSTVFSRLKPAAAAVMALVLAAAWADATANDHHIRIHRFANIQPLREESTSPSGHSASKRYPNPTHELNVFGKQLKFNLQDNQQVIDTAHSEHAQLLKGKLEGNNQSWVRLTKTSKGDQGLIWDGAELYVIEPAISIRNNLSQGSDLPSSDTVIFKMSDTTVDLGTDYCGADTHPSDTSKANVNNGLTTYRALTNDISNQLTSTPTLRLEMQALADASFREKFTNDQDAMDALLVRINNIDGIFSSQLELNVQASNIHIYNKDPGLLSTSNNPIALLSALAQLRNSSAVMGTYAVTHLFTGRDLEGETLGIAYIGNVCNTHYAVGLSEVGNRGAWIDSLVAAHELGHQLGAVHDGTGACSNSPAQGYLMDSIVNGNSAFSQCSKDTIVANMQSATCLVPISSMVMNLTTTTETPDPNSAEGGAGSLDMLWLGLLLTLIIYKDQPIV